MQKHEFNPNKSAMVVLFIASILLTGCDSQPSGADLYTLNCAGCHGAAGKGGSAIALSDAAYLATRDDMAMARLTSDGIPNTTMRAFGRSKGGSLTDEQITAIVKYLREVRKSAQNVKR